MQIVHGDIYHYEYRVAKYLQEEANRMEFTEYAQENIFKKAGMSQSGYFSFDALPSNTALGYIKLPDGTWKTNNYSLPYQSVPKEEIQPYYSLRWQIEILFKTWKSLFQIHKVKKMKMERFECDLYGTLISLLISSTIAFQVREYLLRKKKMTVFDILRVSYERTIEEATKGTAAYPMVLKKI